MEGVHQLKKDYPWTQTPLVVSAPMRLIALADMAVEVSKAGGLGFISSGTDTSTLAHELQAATSLLQHCTLPTESDTLPLGIGFINWSADLATALPLIRKYRPAAVWFFAPSSLSSLQEWTAQTRAASPHTKIWIQIGSVREALDAVSHAAPDVLVVQGTDAGGHGLARGASLFTLLPEVHDALCQQQAAQSTSSSMPVLAAAGGITEGRGAAAALTLGAAALVLGTRFLAAPEARISHGYRAAILSAVDGGQCTVRTNVYDKLRGTTGWAATHNARGVINRSYSDAVAGMSEDENKRAYEREVEKGDDGWGVEGRMTTYAGSGVGLIKTVQPAGEIVREVREGARGVVEGMYSWSAKEKG
ncbi:inosine monophosphate dehydrogenase [Bimuria novae-zelandiae CBS 107.79]|uniref:Inosine monophosphate dehydrogenase n=1 Tax=Bimuria novae-zelandiae CBS 107.79 TaxID=1447943 RepID=A0A6A5V2F4_9PLEO|nr:inosine monophosphate dehydrogenase [Bimuria novae-zelandiae CBS 107.79]